MGIPIWLSPFLPLIRVNLNCAGRCQDMEWYLGGSLWCHTESKVDREVNIINGFFKNYPTSAIRNYLLPDDYYIDPSNSSSNPFSKGSVVLKVNSSDVINNIELKNYQGDYSLTKYHDAVHGTQTNNWFYFSNNQNLGDTDPKYGLTLPNGVYSIYTNENDTKKTIEIKGAQTTMMKIDLYSEPEPYPEGVYHLDLYGINEATYTFNNTIYNLRFGSLNTIGNYCKLRIINGDNMEFLNLKTGIINQSSIFPLLFNTTLCDIDKRILEFSISLFEEQVCAPTCTRTTDLCLATSSDGCDGDCIWDVTKNTQADTNCDNIVSRTELGIAINKWVDGTFSRSELGTAIQSWVNE